MTHVVLVPCSDEYAKAIHDVIMKAAADGQHAAGERADDEREHRLDLVVTGNAPFPYQVTEDDVRFLLVRLERERARHTGKPK